MPEAARRFSGQQDKTDGQTLLLPTRGRRPTGNTPPLKGLDVHTGTRETRAPLDTWFTSATPLMGWAMAKALG